MQDKFKRFLLMLVTVSLPLIVQAQSVNGIHEDLDFSSPEAWAMSYMVASTLNLALQPPKSIEFGDIRLSAELASIPHLNREQQQVGFGGFKSEDLNKSPAFGLARASLGLIWDVTAELSWTPPVEINGAKPDLMWGLALSKPLIISDSWGLGLRLYKIDGSVLADVTCSEKIAEFPPFSSQNLFGCIGKSEDKLEMDHHGAEVILSFNKPNMLLKPWVSIASTKMYPFVEIDAPLEGSKHSSTLSTEGKTITYSIGFNYRLNEKWGINMASSYTPLEARRIQKTGRQDNFWNIRLGLVWDL